MPIREIRGSNFHLDLLPNDPVPPVISSILSLNMHFHLIELGKVVSLRIMSLGSKGLGIVSSRRLG